MEENKNFDDIFKAFGKYAETIATQFATNFMASSIDQTIKEYERSAVNVLKSFGTGRDRIVELKASMADAVTSVKLMGGELSNVAQIAQDIGSALNRNMILTSESYSKLYAATEVTGVGVKTLANSFKDAGFSVYQISQNMEKVVNTARAQGINAQVVSQQVVQNMGLMDKYNFAGGVEGLAKMVTQATSLRISVSDIANTMQKAFEPESAIEMAAALQRLGMAQGDLLDPLRLMDLAQNDPAELQNQIAEMSKTFVEFNEQTKSFQIAPGAKRQLQEVAGALGMQPEAFAKMAKAAAEMDDKLQKISFPDAFSEDQKKFIANMAEMGEGGEYMLRVDNKDLGIDEAMKLFQEQPAVYEKFIKESKPKSMEELAKEQLTTTERMAANVNSIANRMGAAVASSETQEQANQASIQLTEALPKILGGENLQVKGMRDAGDKIAQDIIKGVQSGDIMGGLSKAEKGTEDYFKGAFGQAVDGAKLAFDDLGKSSNPLINIMGTLTTKVGELVAKSENLGESFFKTSETVKKTSGTLDGTAAQAKATTVTATAAATTTATTEKSKELTPPKGPETTTTDVKFTAPLEIKLSFTGLPTNITEAEIRKMIDEGKFSQEIAKAIAEAEKQKTKQ
jgi:hypothetical protein